MDDHTPIFTFVMAQDDYETFITRYPGSAETLRTFRARAEQEMARRKAQWGLLTPADQHHISTLP